ncbi:hypothetical protein KCU62_g6122, partial [Aureobasidium sp. EXF-3399]
MMTRISLHLLPGILNKGFRKEQNEAGLDRYIGTHNTVAILTTGIERLLQLPGPSTLVVQGVDTLTASWQRFTTWAKSQDRATILVVAYAWDTSKDPQLRGLCQVAGESRSYAVFTLADIVDYAGGVSNCNRVTMLKTSCLTRQGAKDRQHKDFKDSDDYQIRHGRNYQGGVRTF